MYQSNVTTMSSRRESRLASIQQLERRLNDGYARIEAARAAGQDVADWESFWIELLHQYEAAVDATMQRAA